jgi:membrane protein
MTGRTPPPPVPGTPLHRALLRAYGVIRQVVTGVWEDGFIHAGNLAYMAILSLFPFFIVVGALFSAVGEAQERAASVHALLAVMPPVVRHVLEPVGRDVIAARHGWLLWIGFAVGLWTVSSLIETMRDILRRAYGSASGQAEWLRDRLLSTAMIVVAVVLLLASLYLQVAITAAQEVIRALLPGMQGALVALWFAQVVPVVVLFASLWLLFYALSPSNHRRSADPKWPGALLVTAWWGLVSLALPVLLRSLFKYDLTYGSLAGVMISLFFFWLVGLGVVTGAELNAALTGSAQAGLPPSNRQET